MFTKGQKLIAIRDTQSHYGDVKIKKGETLVYGEPSRVNENEFIGFGIGYNFKLADFLPYPEKGTRLRAVRDTKSRLGVIIPKGTELIAEDGITPDDGPLNIGVSDSDGNYYSITYSPDYEVIEMSKATEITAEWKDGVLTASGQELQLCTRGLKVLGVKEPDATFTYKFRLTAELLEAAPPKLKPGQLVRVKDGSSYTYTKTGWIGVITGPDGPSHYNVRGPRHIGSTNPETYSLRTETLEVYCG